MTTTATAPAPAPKSSLGSRAFGFLQKIGKSLMLPVAVLPVAGILLGVGGAFINGFQQRAFNLGVCVLNGAPTACNVEGAVGAVHLRGQRLHGRTIGHVDPAGARDGRPGGPAVGRRPLGGELVDVDRQHRRTPPGQRQGGAPTDPAPCAGDEGERAGQVHPSAAGHQRTRPPAPASA